MDFFSVNTKQVQGCVDQEAMYIRELNRFEGQIRNVRNNMNMNYDSEKIVKGKIDILIKDIEKYKNQMCCLQIALVGSVDKYNSTESKLLKASSVYGREVLKEKSDVELTEEEVKIIDDCMEQIDWKNLDWEKLIEYMMLTIPGLNITIGMYKLIGYIEQKYQERMKLKEEKAKRIEEIVLNVSDPTKLTEAKKREFIECYEFLHGTEGKKVDKLLEIFKENGEDVHIQNIKMLLYTAEEPYKSIFMDNIDKIKIGTINLSSNETQNYSSATQKISLSMDKWNLDNNGNVAAISSATYVTFFHECAHAIDDALVPGKGNLTDTYVDASGRKLTEVLENNVRETIRDSVDDYLNGMGYTDEEIAGIKKEVEEAIMNCVDIKEYGSPIFTNQDVEDCYNAVVKDIKNQISGSSSDVFGGYTGNTLMNGTYHPAVRINDNNIKYSYWTNGTYDSATDSYIVWTEADGSLSYTDKQAKEFFAEYMAAQMTGNQKEKKGLNAYSSDTISFYKEMVANEI